MYFRLSLLMNDLINAQQGIRPRYVDPILLPPKRVISLTEQMAADRKERDTEAYRKRHEISFVTGNKEGEARRLLESSILSHIDEVEEDVDQSLSLHHANLKKRKSEEKRLALTNQFLVKPVVKYGANRITSTHNSKGKIEEPWSTIKGRLGDRLFCICYYSLMHHRYTTLAGDRTA